MKHTLTLFLLLISKISFASSVSVSGISSGGFMAMQMGTIYSDQVSSVATVAGGVYFCAENHFQEMINKYGEASLLAYKAPPTKDILKNKTQPEPHELNPLYKAMSICMHQPEKAHQGENEPMNLEFLKELEASRQISSLENIKHQRILIYHGAGDDVIKVRMVEKLKEFYSRLGVEEKHMSVVITDGQHNFPTDRNDGIDCNEEKVPYVANCNFNLAERILENALNRKIVRGKFNSKNLHIIAQKNAPSSIQSYGYLYATPHCMDNPSDCDLHVAIHGCKMSDDYDENFQKRYEAKVQLSQILTIQDYELKNRKRQMGARIFAEKAGYSEYADVHSNRLMVYFPQTRISTANYPKNPKGCWDWYGWTGTQYATNQGAEAQWLHNQIQNIKINPRELITNKTGDHILQ